MDDKDHLTVLPPELLHIVISYLFPTHKPDIAFEDKYDSTPRLKSQHPLDFLAVTCRTLHTEVNDWAETFLRQHPDITRYPASAARLNDRPRRNWLRGRGGLLWWSARSCVFCGRATKKLAIFMNGLHCCKDCDNLHWPHKMTKTAAMQEFYLNGYHLLPHKERTRMPAKLRKEDLSWLPRLTYGTLITAGVPTTMFLEKDVEALATLVHGDLEAYLAKRNVQREERSRKLRATQAKKMAISQQRVNETIQAGSATEPSRTVASGVAPTGI